MLSNEVTVLRYVTPDPPDSDKPVEASYPITNVNGVVVISHPAYTVDPEVHETGHEAATLEGNVLEVVV
jgi:hypothetical protein